MTARSVAASLLATVLSILAALVIVGCGGSATADGTTPGHRAPVPSIADATALNTVLAADQRAAAALVAAGPLLAGNARHADGWFLGQELTHAGVLRSLVAMLGGVAHSPALDYHFRDPRSVAQVLALLRSVEGAQLEADGAAIAHIDRGWLRARVAALAADDAQQLAVVRFESGLQPSGSAFPIPYRSSLSRSDAATERGILAAQAFAVRVYRWALRDGRLTGRARGVVAALLAQERDHVAALARLLAGSTPEIAGMPEPAEILRGVSAQQADQLVRREGGVITLLEALQSREEGLLYFDALPRLQAADAPFATSLLANEAMFSVMLSELRKPGDSALAAPAPLVRGWRVGPRPPW